VNQLWSQGASGSFGINSDCVYGGTIGAANNTNCLLTTAWSAAVAYEHFWSPSWHQSFSGAYMAESYGAAANGILCALEGASYGAGVGSAAAAVTGCNNNWSYWTAGSRLQWDVTKSFYIGVEALYMHFNTATVPSGAAVPTVSGLAAPSTCAVAGPVGGGSGLCTNANQSDWAFTLRMHKDFLP